MEKKLTKEEFLDYTISVWQPYFSRPLTREDARQFSETAVNFLHALSKENSQELPKPPVNAP